MENVNLEDFGPSFSVSYDASDKSIDQAIRDAGLDPDEWTVDRAALGATGRGTTLKVSLTRNLVLPARTPGPIYGYTPPLHNHGFKHAVPKIWVVLGDAQCPYHDRRMHELVCKFLDRFRPDGLIADGDISDFPTLSSYLPNPKTDTDANASIQSTYDVLSDWAGAAGVHCEKLWLPGNHEQRFQKYLLRNAPNLWGLTRAGPQGDGESVLALPYLLRLDELGYRVVTAPTGEWPQAMVDLVPGKLTVTHGWLTRKGSGATARASAEWLGRSVVVGHTHRLAVTPYRKNGETIWGVENGTLAQVEGGLGYAVEPDWIQGLTVIHIFDDQTFTIGQAVRVGDRLVYGSEVID